MKREVVIWSFFLLAIACFITAVYTGPRYHEFAMVAAVIYLVSWLGFMFIAIYEVNSFTSLGFTAKVFWTLGILFLSPVIGLIYLLSARRALIR